LQRSLGVPRRPIIAYFDGHLTSPFTMPKHVDWIAVNAYLDPSYQHHSVDSVRKALKNTIIRQLDLIPAGVPVLLVAQAYDRNGAWTNMRTLSVLQYVYANVARECTQVKGILWFAYARQGGVNDHPELAPYHAKIARAIKGRPPYE